MNNKFKIFDPLNRLQDDVLSVYHVLTRRCNQYCSYCFWNYKQTPELCNRLLTLNDFDKILDFLELQERKISYSFHGGEPTVHPHLLEFCERINKRLKDIHKIQIFTNLKKSTDYYRKLTSIENVTLKCTFHSSEVKDPDKWFNKLIEVSNSTTKIKLMYDGKNLKILSELFRKYKPLLEHTNSVSICPIDGVQLKEFEDDNTNSYIDDVGHIEDKNGNILKEVRDCRNFRMMMCKSGCIILENGDVYRCFNDIKTNKPVINCIIEQPKKLNEWKFCPYSECECETHYAKLSIDEYKTRFQFEKD